MKNLLIALLCLLFVCLCACGQGNATDPDETVTNTGETTQISAGLPMPSIGEVIAETETTTAKTTKVPTTITQYSTVPKAKIIANKDDPYSYVIKEWYDTLYDYHKDSIDLSGNPYLNHYYYAFYDIDGNGTKALFLGEDKCIETVYVVQNGVAVLQEEYFWHDESIVQPRLFENGTIVKGEYSYYRLENGKFRNKTVLEKDGKYYHFTINGPYPGVSITKEEFDRVRKEYEGNGEIVKIDWKPLAEYGK